VDIKIKRHIMHKLWAAFILILAVLITASFTSAFMLLVAFPFGVPLAANGSAYWFNLWLMFDKFMNAMIGGYRDETVSSALGKSVIFRCEPVFFNRRIDVTVSWLLHQVDPSHCRKAIDWEVGEEFTVSETLAA
tara:strand:+ start:1142 stop:1543 length:402 start_codon:yes stop_codon:yes gene_type:complete